MSKKAFSDQRGMVSITVTMVIIALVTLITIGFATLVRRDQRQALDRQLSTQAYYAAETGINDAVEWLKTNTDEISQCSDTPSAFPNHVLNAADGVEYSCLLVDRTPDKLTFDPVGTDKSVIFPVRSSTGLPITRINLSWQSKEEGNEFAVNTVHHLLSDDEWADGTGGTGRTSILRVDLIPVDNLSRDSLIAGTRTFFLYPKDASSPGVGQEYYNSSKTAQHLLVDANCNTGNTPQFCNAQLNLFTTTPPALQPYFNSYYLRIKSVYADSIVTVTAFSSGSQVELADAQAVVDVTGKASDVLRRLQVTIPLLNDYDYPEFALETTDTICKRLEVWPAGPGNPVGGAGYEPLPTNFNPNINPSTPDPNTNENICSPTTL